MPRNAKKAVSSTAQSSTPQMLSVRAIRALDDVQPRSDLNTMVIKEYATLYSEAEGDEPLPPIDVFTVDGKHYVSDGFHRLAAAKEAKRSELPCHVYTGSLQEAMRHGIFANLKRGLAYSQGDRERILTRLLQDPEVSQQSDRALAQALGLSHVTVGRARHRLAAQAKLAEEWRALPLTQTQENARRQEQFATFLAAEPTLVANYEKLTRDPLETDRIITWVARRMTDQNEPEEVAKAAVREHFQREVRSREQMRGLRRQLRGLPPAKETPEARAQREALEARKEEEAQRRRRGNHLYDIVLRFAALHEGVRESWNGGPCTFADLWAALSPEHRQKLPDLLSQAEAVIQTLKDALASSAA
jgi:uncharacterized ParB-like nuclease family protein